MSRLTGRAAVVTGAGRGPGRSIAARLAAEGVVAVRGGLTGRCADAACRAGLFGFVTTLASELAPCADFTANLVSPGVVPTDMSARAIADFGDRLRARIPLERLGNADDVAAAVAYLRALETSVVNSHTLVVAGGYSLGYGSRKRRGAHP